MKNTIQASLLILLCSFFVVSQINAQNIQEKEKSGIPDNCSFKGFFNTTDAGLLLGSSKNNQKAPFSFMSVTGYHLTEKLALGIGVGIDFLEESCIPIVADVRYYFRNTNFSPFVFVQAGYSISVEDNVSHHIYNSFNSIPDIPKFSIDKIKAKGGILINPGFGIRKMLGKNFGIMFSVSYRYQKLNYEATEENKLELEYNRLNLRVGIIFK
jgi:hypothetical protein